MNDREATVRSRTVADRLHRALKAKGWNVSMLGAAMGWSHSRTSRFLACKRGADILDVATALGHLGVRGTDRDEILELSADLYERSWWQERGERLSARLPVVSRLEQIASAISAFHPTQIPDLLQVPNYTRTLLRAGSVVSSEEIEKHIALLEHRHTIVDRTGRPELRFVVVQQTLTHDGVGRGTMAEQVHHLLRLSDRPHVRIQVLPQRACLLLRYPPFELLSFTDGRPAVHLEMLNVTGFLEDPTTVTIFHRALADLGNAALGEHESRAWLNTLAATLGTP